MESVYIACNPHFGKTILYSNTHTHTHTLHTHTHHTHTPPSVIDRLRPSLERIHSLTVVWTEVDSLSLQPFSSDNQVDNHVHVFMTSWLAVGLYPEQR